MRNKIFGFIGMLWGGAILANGIFGKTPQGTEAYQAGQTGAFVLGGLLLVAGAFYFFKKPAISEKEPEEGQH
jgi:hypothetical protein